LPQKTFSSLVVLAHLLWSAFLLLRAAVAAVGGAAVVVVAVKLQRQRQARQREPAILSLLVLAAPLVGTV
jgi:anti-sigma-K factor RskA